MPTGSALAQPVLINQPVMYQRLAYTRYQGRTLLGKVGVTNRPVRTRMPAGVAGAQSAVAFPYADE